MPQFLDSTALDFDAAFTALLSMKREDSPDVDAVVAQIIADVRARGDAAVIEAARMGRRWAGAGRLCRRRGFMCRAGWRAILHRC